MAFAGTCVMARALGPTEQQQAKPHGRTVRCKSPAASRRSRCLVHQAAKFRQDPFVFSFLFIYFWGALCDCTLMHLLAWRRADFVSGDL
jgi:hypothetical protein